MNQQSFWAGLAVVLITIIGCTYWFIKRADMRHEEALHDAELSRRVIEDAENRRIDALFDVAEQQRRDRIIYRR